MRAYRYWAYDGVVEADARVVAYDDVAHGIVDTREAFYDALPSKLEAVPWHNIHPCRRIDVARPLRWCETRPQHSHPPSWAGECLIDDAPMKDALQCWMVI